MSIFTFKDNKIEIEPLNLTIPEFKEIYERDKSKGKVKAFEELAYIYHMSDFKSPYSNYDDDEKEKTIINDFFLNGFTPDVLVKKAIIKYTELNQTPSMRLLADARKAIEQMRKYFSTVDLNEIDSKGQKVNRLSELSTSLGNLGKIIESIDKLEERVKKEQATANKVRGDKDISEFER